MAKEERTLIGWGVAAVVAMLAILFFTSCKSQKEIERVYVHDTLCMTQIEHDSVDRWHTHYEYMKGDTIYSIDTLYLNKVCRVHDTVTNTKYDIQTKEVEKVVEKKVYVWWPLIVVGSLLAVGCVVIWPRKREK